MDAQGVNQGKVELSVITAQPSTKLREIEKFQYGLVSFSQVSFPSLGSSQRYFRSDWISRSYIPMSDSMLQLDPKVNRPLSGSETAQFALLQAVKSRQED